MLARQLHRALAEGRVCSNCGWMISIKNWAKGFRLCPGCADALKGVNVDRGSGRYRDEPVDMTGEHI
jgi:predicted RNA-binding Zn-ribbon protein involved in translation (DUF1610 family)